MHRNLATNLFTEGFGSLKYYMHLNIVFQPHLWMLRCNNCSKQVTSRVESTYSYSRIWLNERAYKNLSQGFVTDLCLTKTKTLPFLPQ